MSRFFILYFSLLIGLAACGTKKNLSSIEEAKSDFVMPDLKSTLNIHFRIDKEAINDTFNTVIDSYLAGDMELTALGMEVKVSKKDMATMEFLGRDVLTTLPIEIGLEKSSFLANINASGILELNFITNIDIDSSWQLKTMTRLEDYHWMEEPQLSLGGLKLSIGSLANSIIEKSKDTFEDQIDASVAEQMDVRSQLLETMKYIEQPILVDSLLNSWVHVKPTHIYMSSVENASGYSVGNLTVHGNTKVSESKPNHTPGLKLPEFKWENKLDDTSHINVVMDVSYKHINEYLQENYKGERFENGKKHITINDIELKKSKDKLVAVSDVTGSVNGKLYVSAVPRFNNQEQSFFADDIDIEIKTKNVIHKAGAWMFKGKIKNRLKEMMYFSIDENLKDIQKNIDTQIKDYSIKDKLDLKADLRKINVNKFVLDNDRIHAFVTINLFLQTTIHDMSAFREDNKRLK